MTQWAHPLNLLREEVLQIRDEGTKVPPALLERINTLPAEEAWNEALIGPLFADLAALPRDTALAAREPNGLDEIRRLRPQGPRVLPWEEDEARKRDRFHGAWTGRAAGCALGKPVEGMGMSSREGKPAGRRRIKAYLQARGDWPLRDYFSGRDAGDGETLGCPASQRERIAYMEADDDIHYSLVGLGVLEKFGPDFRWQDIASYWEDHIPYGYICTAETQALLNYWNRSARSDNGNILACDASWTATHRNPYREWIGAQIRSDGWAWVCAGKPELAAEFAWRDAHWTHVRSGIYGEMFCAAMQAAAFVEHDVPRLIEIGLSEIPAECRLALAVRDLLAARPRLPDWEAAMDWVEARCAEISPGHFWQKQPSHGMSPVHTINNALVCVLALLYGGLDTLKAPAIAVMCALDTDCNGASVGSIVGAAAGRSGFNENFARPLNDTMRPCIIGFTEITFAELARRTQTQWQRVDAWHLAR